MSKFQLIVLGIFVLFIVAGVTAFALFKGSSGTKPLPTITIWGTFSSATFDQFLAEVNSARTTPLAINYVQVDPTNFNQNFVQAIARGQGPDAILIPQDMLLENEPELLTIPYTVMPERDFLDTYIQEADLYLQSTGIVALPFSVDPLVMYWNRDTFNSAGIASVGTPSAPMSWSTLASFNPKITQEDQNSNIQKSLIAMGEFANVDNAREILSSLLLQAGNPITKQAADDSVASALGNSTYQGLKTSTDAVSFFVRFADPTDPNYSWNRSLPDSQTFFLSGNLATYFGFASELSEIRAKNPNLNFDVAPLPQADKETARVTYGQMYGFSLVKSSPNSGAAFTDLQYLITPTALAQWTTLSTLPPVRRDMIAAGTTDPYMAIFYDSALISQGWLDPNPLNSTTIFQNMVESITSGAATVENSVQSASDELDLSIKSI